MVVELSVSGRKIRVFVLFCHMVMEARLLDPQYPESVTLCSFDPVVSQILSVMTA
jgi:hypothetical protein